METRGTGGGRGRTGRLAAACPGQRSGTAGCRGTQPGGTLCACREPRGRPPARLRGSARGAATRRFVGTHALKMHAGRWLRGPSGPRPPAGFPPHCPPPRQLSAFVYASSGTLTTGTRRPTHTRSAAQRSLRPSHTHNVSDIGRGAVLQQQQDNVQVAHEGSHVHWCEARLRNKATAVLLLCTGLWASSQNESEWRGQRWQEEGQRGREGMLRDKPERSLPL